MNEVNLNKVKVVRLVERNCDAVACSGFIKELIEKYNRIIWDKEKELIDNLENYSYSHIKNILQEIHKLHHYIIENIYMRNFQVIQSLKKNNGELKIHDLHDRRR